jgi:hypothetical protein
LTVINAVYFHVQTAIESALFDSQVGTIMALTKGCKSVKVVRDVSEIPTDGHLASVNDTLTVHALVQVSACRLLHGQSINGLLPGHL